ncbi:transcription-silencing protein clr2 [Ophiostoma piceae UAMH 11346]|uniref:Transcription-silencing protein clr2 n=1 Tax=Ophiostoma piceae (strain UAMH 11346) TaxID=1262450 RepID=S3CCK4_OPHP1|nr:transcription-silencing protein clr2 [Ophiostoma piceae UAMH 11346]
MSSRPVIKAPVGRPSTKAAASAPMTKTPSSSSATGGTKSKGAPSAVSAAPTSAPPLSSNLQTYRELFIARSDGIGYTTQQINDASRSAQPVGDALDESTDFVRSWSVKLGKAIKYNLGAGATSAASTTDPNNYLMRFPEGYALHVRPGKTKERDGPLVFGHPLSPIAVFRSPAEFALHILWLMSSSKLREDCSCRLCVRMVSESISSKAEADAAKSVPTPAEPARPQAKPRTVTPIAPPAIPVPGAALSQAPKATGALNTTAGKPLFQPLPMGGAAGLFRPWELVWYQHFLQPSRGAWRLGIVLQIKEAVEAPPSTMPGPLGTICVAPIGFKGLEQLSINASELRPFLSFSVPAMRQGFQGLTYDQSDWHQLVLEAQQQLQLQQPPQPGRYDVPTIALEASKAAANQINACFSVFNQLPKETPQTTKCTYGGVFLGAEMILLGDAIRVDAKEPAGGSRASTAGLLLASGETGDPSPHSVDVMWVTAIMTEQGQLRFFGNIYQLALAQPGSVLPPMKPSGAVFEEELEERNSKEASASAASNPNSPIMFATWFWQLRELNASRAESDVHGRFYSSTRLAANLQNATFLQRVQQEPLAGPYDDSCIAASALNRRQKVSEFMYLGERQNRAATIGQAMSIPLPPIDGVKEGI